MTYKHKLLCLPVLAALFLGACNRPTHVITPCEGVACTMIFASVSVYVADNSGQPVLLDEAYSVKQSTGEVIRGGNHPGDGIYTILDDGYQKRIATIGVDLRFIGKKNGTVVVDEPYRVIADCCHVSKASGKDTLVVQ